MSKTSSLRSTLPFLARIVAALLLVALVPLLYASWRLISVNRDSMELQVKTTQIIATRTAADAITTFVETRRALARTIVESPILSSADGAAISTLLQSSLQAWSNLDIEGIALFDQQDVMLLGTRISGSELNLGQWLGSAPPNQDGSGASLEVEGQRILLIIREPLTNGGSVLLLGDTAALRQPLQPSQLIDDSGAVIAVFDRNGRQIAGSLGDIKAPKSLMDQATAGSVEGSGTYRTGDTGDDVSYIAAYSPIDTTDWSVVAMQPRSIAEQVALRMRKRAISALAIALVLVFLLVFFAYRLLVKPLQNLLLAQRRLAKSRSRITGGNLINQLQQSFEELEERLEDQRDLGEIFLGRYQILELIGRGGMGTVFRGWDPELERYLALKTVRFDKVAMGNNSLVTALLDEAKTTARMHHPNVVQVFDVASSSQSAFIAMELVDGISLEEWIQRGLPPAPLAIPATLGIAEGLNAAHHHDILHRDIKAANVLLGYSGSIKVTDFGLAKLLQTQQLEADEQVFGTPGHIAPEVLLGLGTGKPADVFAMGIVLHYMLSGYTPFRASTVRDTLKKTLKGDVARLSHLRPEIPAPLEVLLLKMLSTDPQARPITEEIVDLLHTMQAEFHVNWKAPAKLPDQDTGQVVSPEQFNAQKI